MSSHRHLYAILHVPLWQPPFVESRDGRRVPAHTESRELAAFRTQPLRRVKYRVDDLDVAPTTTQIAGEVFADLIH
jgi:hypothetical protein